MKAILKEINAKIIDTNEIHRNGAPDVASIDLNPSVANCKNPYLDLPFNRTRRRYSKEVDLKPRAGTITLYTRLVSGN